MVDSHLPYIHRPDCQCIRVKMLTDQVLTEYSILLLNVHGVFLTFLVVAVKLVE